MSMGNVYTANDIVIVRVKQEYGEVQYRLGLITKVESIDPFNIQYLVKFEDGHNEFVTYDDICNIATERELKRFVRQLIFEKDGIACK